MTRKRHTEEQIIGVLKDAQAGIGIPELCRKHGISDATFYTWRTKYAGLEISDGCAASWPLIARRSGIAVDATRIGTADPDPGDCRAEAAVWLSPDLCVLTARGLAREP